MDKIMQLSNGQFDLVTEMVLQQKRERKEQFATILCKSVIDDDGFEYLVADDFQYWPSNNLEQTEGSVSPESWDWVTANILSKNKAADYRISTVVSLHTHPGWFGTNGNLDATDTQTFKMWTQVFRSVGIDMINGIVSSNGSLKLYRYDQRTDSFENVICQVEDEFVQSTLPSIGGRGNR